MKTPMQEHIEWLDIQWGNAKDCGEKTIDFEIAMKHAESMLEKEKEVMCEFAFNCSDEIKDQNNWRSPRNLTNYEVILDFYNETFNTKEK